MKITPVFSSWNVGSRVCGKCACGKNGQLVLEGCRRGGGLMGARGNEEKKEKRESRRSFGCSEEGDDGGCCADQRRGAGARSSGGGHNYLCSTAGERPIRAAASYAAHKGATRHLSPLAARKLDLEVSGLCSPRAGTHRQHPRPRRNSYEGAGAPRGSPEVMETFV